MAPCYTRHEAAPCTITSSCFIYFRSRRKRAEHVAKPNEVGDVPRTGTYTDTLSRDYWQKAWWLFL